MNQLFFLDLAATYLLFYGLTLAYLPVSFFLHNIIHEGSHALMAKAFGAKDITLWPFPGRRMGGHFTWAHFTFKGPIVGGVAVAMVSIAPVFAELAWLLVMCGLSILAAGTPAALFLAVELLFSAVDITTWGIGAFMKSNWNDAAVYRDSLKLSLTRSRLSASLMVLGAWIIAAGGANILFG